ncbi:MmyB family transcriptional regulator [Streptomyces sp. NPDC054933]
MDDGAIRDALQAVLRTRRASIDPGRYGFTRPATQGRHAGGLGLTQAQVDKILNRSKGTYQRLESGRYPKAPEGLLKAVAVLLRLNEHEWGWLWRMTWRRDPPYPLHTVAGEQVPGAWRRIIGNARHIAYCTNHRWEMLDYNEALVRALPRGQVPHNSVEWTLIHPDARHVLGDWEESWARQVVPLLASARATYPHDTVLADLERKVRADKRCGPIYEEFGPVYSHTDGAIRPFVHAERGRGWVTICSAPPRAAPTCHITQMLWDPGEERPVPLPPIPAIPGA